MKLIGNQIKEQKEISVPIKSPAQYGLMAARMNGNSSGSNKGIGPSPQVAKEFINKTPSIKRKNFAQLLSKKRFGK